jgi:quaternary ammonium compound-resistance protein SugE
MTEGDDLVAWTILVASGVLEAVWASALGASDGFTKRKPTVLFAVALVLGSPTR